MLKVISLCTLYPSNMVAYCEHIMKVTFRVVPGFETIVHPIVMLSIFLHLFKVIIVIFGNRV
jgi:hypothetical protein